MSLTYHKLEWIHDFEDEPGLFYFEVGDDRYATRSIEVFEDGRTVRASEEDLERDPMALPDQPVLAVEEKIDASGETRTWAITAQQFEVAWSAASGDRSPGC
jgi:hypothetical protein